MGMRGQGAGLRNQAQAELDERPARRFPWLRRGLGRAERVIAFLEFLPITKGPLAGKRMKLLPEQLRFVRAVYATDRKGLRKVRIGVKSEPKGNGKTGLVAGLCLCHLLGPEAEPRGEVYSAAIDRQQAALIFAEMEAILHQVPEFLVRVNISRFMKRMEVLEGVGDASTYEALSADARRAHGIAPSLFAYDELAQAKDRVLLDNLINGLGKRKEALGIVISTQAPDDEHPLSQLIDDGLTGADPSIYVQLTAAPEDADPFAEATWLACNPALGKFLSLQEMHEAAERARRIPAFEPAFRNLRLNQRIDASEERRLIPRREWELCEGPVDRDELLGRSCYAGLDLSGKQDLTSFTLVFPDDEAETGYDILPFFWTPEGAMAARRLREQDFLKRAIADGFVTAVPGPTIRYRYMAQQIGELRRRYDIRVIAFDPWRIDDFKQDMTDEGIDDLPLEPFIQGWKSFGPAIEYFAELATTARLRSAANPVLRACVTTAITITDTAGNLKIDKDASNNSAMVRIDGAVTLVMALGIAKRFVGEAPLDVMAMVA